MIKNTKKARKPRKNQFVVRQGAMPPSAQVMHFSPEQWEGFIERACEFRRQNSENVYVQVKRIGGSGDAGRDIEARLVPTLEIDCWDLYQAKHYDHCLNPSDVFTELAKFFKHLSAGTYPRPRVYYLCSPQNAGPKLHDMLASPIKLKEELLKAWETGGSGLKAQVVELTSDVRTLVSNFDFSRIQECLVRDLLAWHEIDQKAHFELFGIEPERGDDPELPPAPLQNEQVYIEELIRVYGEGNPTTLTLEDLDDAFLDHFQSQRASFYCAEGLKRFSRDLYTENEFDSLLSMILSGIRPSISSPSLKTGMSRLDEAIKSVSTIQLSDSKLSTRLRGGDLPGTCHHLVNEKKIRWVK